MKSVYRQREEMKIYLLLAMLLSTSVSADECGKHYTYLIESKKVDYCVHKKTKALVTRECSDGKCKALDAYFSEDMNNLEITTKERFGGKNPSTILCDKLGGKLSFGISQLEHHQYFCNFTDNSSISTASLYEAYQEAN